MAAQSFPIDLPGLHLAAKGAGPCSGNKATGGVAGACALMLAPSETGFGSRANSTLCETQLLSLPASLDGLNSGAVLRRRHGSQRGTRGGHDCGGAAGDARGCHSDGRAQEAEQSAARRACGRDAVGAAEQVAAL